MPRCFLALNLSPETKAEFRKIQADLKAQNPDLIITWVNPAIAHVNILFLDNLDENALNNLTQKLIALEANFGPISACFKAVSAFPDLKKPKILYLSLNYSPNLKTLHQALSNVIKQQKIILDHRPYTPHITLGRLKNSIPLKLPTLPLTKNFIITAFDLMSSTLTPAGPIYHLIKKYKL
ncbi:MAG TPA: RNA 2',3'-cyclic phosphodiesterase [bacterium]|nr:RNA 2',3'-cyclic phosphodiesterase [bacterium]HPL95640.1 RNA 2',3'-cyclic phosphodiesterase [bacterium]